MIGANELSATVRAEMVALLHGRIASGVILEPDAGRGGWPWTARTSPSAHRRLRRDRARARLLAQLMGDTQREAEDQVDNTLADSFPASDPPYWTLGVARRPELERSADNDEKQP